MSLQIYSPSNEGADIVIRTSDQQDLYTHKCLLARASAFFRGMFTVPQPSSGGDTQIVAVTEGSDVSTKLLSWIDPICKIDVNNLIVDDVAFLIGPVDKYDMEGVRGTLCSILRASRTDFDTALRAWALSLRLGDDELIKELTRSAIVRTGRERMGGDELNLVPAYALFKLDRFRYQCSDEVENIFRADASGLVVTPKNPVVCEAAEKANLLFGEYHSSLCSYNSFMWGGKKRCCGSWIEAYIVELKSSARYHPCKETLQKIPYGCYDALLPAYRCDQCRANLVKKLETFNTIMGQHVEEVVFKIEMPIFI